jgi:hypothetical protein
VRSLLLIGSLAEGYSNASSDIDLIAIVPDIGRRFRMTEHGFDLGDRPASVCYITESNLQRRLKRLDALYRAGGHITDGVATRIASAVVLFDSEGVGHRLVSDAQRYMPSRAVLREMIRVAFGFLNDAVGSRLDGDFGTSTIMARAGASVAVDCILLVGGERNLKPKWHLRRLAKLGATPVLDHYRKVLGLDGITSDDADHVIRQTERLICAVLQVETLDKFNKSPLFLSQE